MKFPRSAGLAGLAVLLLTPAELIAQNQREIRRAQPVGEPPAARALPVDEPTPTPSPRHASEPRAQPTPPEKTATAIADEASDPSGLQVESPDRRQLEYANGLFTRKLHDLAAPEYEKYLAQYPDGSGKANAYFGLGESQRALKRTGPAKSSLHRSRGRPGPAWSARRPRPRRAGTPARRRAGA